MVKKKSKKVLSLFFIPLFLGVFLLTTASFSVYYFEKTYQNKIYPGVKVDNISFGGKTQEDVEKSFSQRNKPFTTLTLTLYVEDNIATISGKQLNSGYDSELMAIQAYSIGRSGNFFSDIYQKWLAVTSGINLQPLFSYNTEIVHQAIEELAIATDIPPKDALFQFKSGKVTLFRLSRSGKKLNQEKSKKIIRSIIEKIATGQTPPTQNIAVYLPVQIAQPEVKTEDSNNLGIKELIGVGKSKFVGSIKSRVHNIELAASKINGRLVAPDAIFSFNEALGDVSSATGFQPAYIIKDGRTVLGDGGGVCQVSTTLFRAILNSGLPVVERHPHSYRVSYYEQDSPPGIDATVFAPSVDLKFKNDTSSYLLIQAKTDKRNSSLVFEIYGSSDGRKVEITKPIILSQSPPPPDLYQDDPTLPKGLIKQVDWKAWGAKVKFDYKVTRNGKGIFKKTFYSNFQPWQAVFLRGTRS